MFGAILGDIVGSPYEFDHNNIKTKNFPLFGKESEFTDDSVMTLAVGKAIMETPDPANPENEALLRANLVEEMKAFGNIFYDAGYGISFFKWLHTPDAEPYGSFGNGSAMRVSAAGWIAKTLEEARYLARVSAAVTHSHPEGIKGAESVAAAIFLARTGSTKEEIKAYVEQEFGYDLSRSCDEIRPDYRHVETCQETVPEAFAAFFEGTSFEDVLRTAVSLGGDSDTLTAIAGSMAEAYYGIDPDWKKAAYAHLPGNLAQILREFDYTYGAAPVGELNPVHEAIRFSEEAHRDQKRKGTEIHYIVHPLEVLQILTEAGASRELQMAGVLHDTVEDTAVSLEQIRQKFGDRVAQLVNSHTEDKSLSWRERKERTLYDLPHQERDVQLLILADAVSNLRSMLLDYRAVGEALWERFNAPKGMKGWYYGVMQDQLIALKDDENARLLYWELVSLYKDLFVEYYLDEERRVLYQITPLESWVLPWGNGPWLPAEETVPAGAKRLPRHKAECLEDLWRWEGRDTTLDGNDCIEEAIIRCKSGELEPEVAIKEVVAALLKRHEEGGHLVMAVEKTENEDGNMEYKLRTLELDPDEEMDEDAICLAAAAFTSQLELNRGPETDALSVDVELALETVLDQEELKGLVLNAWGKTLFLTRNLIKKVVKMIEKLRITIE